MRGYGVYRSTRRWERSEAVHSSIMLAAGLDPPALSLVYVVVDPCRTLRVILAMTSTFQSLRT